MNGRAMKTQERDQLLRALQSRFEKNLSRHKGLVWEQVLSKLESNQAAVRSLHAMEASGGEPDVIHYDRDTGQYLFCDRRYGKVFVYHNGAQSYYAGRGFRGLLRV